MTDSSRCQSPVCACDDWCHHHPENYVHQVHLEMHHFYFSSFFFSQSWEALESSSTSEVPDRIFLQASVRVSVQVRDLHVFFPDKRQSRERECVCVFPVHFQFLIDKINNVVISWHRLVACMTWKYRQPLQQGITATQRNVSFNRPWECVLVWDDKITRETWSSKEVQSGGAIREGNLCHLDLDYTFTWRRYATYHTQVTRRCVLGAVISVAFPSPCKEWNPQALAVGWDWSSFSLWTPWLPLSPTSLIHCGLIGIVDGTYFCTVDEKNSPNRDSRHTCNIISSTVWRQEKKLARSHACINGSLLRACSGEVPIEGWETRQKPHRVLQFGPSRKWNAWETVVCARARNSNQPGKGGSREAMQEEATVAAFAFECLPSPFHSEPVTSAFTRVSDILCWWLLHLFLAWPWICAGLALGESTKAIDLSSPQYWKHDLFLGLFWSLSH